MSLTKAVLSLAAPIPKVESFQTYLFFGPHPDDIEIGCGATAAKLARSGKRVVFAVCTDGRYGDGATSLRGDELAFRRQEESRRSAAVLGVDEPIYLGLSDGGFYEFSELFEAVARVIGEVKPDIVFAPDPSVASECHADHLNVGRAVRQAAYFAPYPGIMKGYGAESAKVKAIAFYYTAKPNSYVGTRGYLKTQLESIFSCHTSQFPTGSEEGRTIRTYLNLRSADFGLRSLRGQAEGFRVLGQTQMHCVSEFG